MPQESAKAETALRVVYFKYIESSLVVRGGISPKDHIQGELKLSAPQATRILRSYREANSGSVTFDSSRKCWITSDDFKPLYLPSDKIRQLLIAKGILGDVKELWGAVYE